VKFTNHSCRKKAGGRHQRDPLGKKGEKVEWGGGELMKLPKGSWNTSWFQKAPSRKQALETGERSGQRRGGVGTAARVRKKISQEENWTKAN